MSERDHSVYRRKDLPWCQLDDLVQQPQQQQRDTHAGLWLDKGLVEQSKGLIERGSSRIKRNAKDHLVREVAALRVPDAYKTFLKRWASGLTDAGAQMRLGTARGRLAVGIGAEAVLENSLALHHTYGVPLIPGSALKGLAAAYAHQCLADERWHKATDETKQADRSETFGAWARHFFGSVAERGNVMFYDALWVPSDDKSPLVPDIINVHHQGYYGTGSVPPADWDSPVPVPLLSARGTYLFALAGGPDEVDATWQILRWALDELGVGAKTSSGYGRIDLKADPCDAAGVANLVAQAASSHEAARPAPPVVPRQQPQQQQPGQPPAPASRPTSAPPARKEGYAVGEVFGNAEIAAIEDEGVIVKLPRGGYGLIQHQDLGGKQYQRGNPARVQVIDVQPGTKTDKILLKPAPPKSKP